MNETQWYNAIYDMLAQGFSPEEIKESVATIDFDTLIDETKKEFDEEN